jgi:hypothetical protein
MLELRPNCELRDRDLLPDDRPRICSYSTSSALAYGSHRPTSGEWRSDPAAALESFAGEGLLCDTSRRAALVERPSTNPKGWWRLVELL